MKQLLKKNIHFIGIGGIGMCGLAELLHNLGATVTGSDLVEGHQVKRLTSLGIPIFIGHKSSHLKTDVNIVVYSSAIKPDNVELLEAQHRKISVIRRSEALAEMMRLKQGIVIAGTHGKTTTTALLASIFADAQKDPTVVAGGRLDLFQSTAHLGKGKWFIAESDESDGSFLHLSPELLVLTNIDDDHVDFYGSFLELKNNFSNFLKKVPFYGAIIACGDCPHTREVVKGSDLSSHLYFYGTQDHNDFVLRFEKKYYTVYYRDKKWATITLPLKGDYNALNALGALVCSIQAGILKKTALQSLKTFKGVQRRLEFKGKVSNILFLDDYAHHPTELKAVLKSLKQEFPNRRRIALFQPHRYSRLQYSWDNFLESFQDVDRVYITEVYPAGEKPLKNINSQRFVKECLHPECFFVDYNNLISQISSELKKNDVFISLGAGSISQWAENILEAVKRI